MLTVGVDTTINAAVDDVWQVLSDISAFDQWNPLIRRVDGELSVGQPATIHVALATGLQAIPVEVSRMTSRQEFGWRFVERHRWLYRGEHIFRIEAAGVGVTRLVDREIFWGLLVPVRRRALQRRITASMTLMGTALKTHVETDRTS